MSDDRILASKLKNLFHTVLLVVNMAGLMALLGYFVSGPTGLIWALILSTAFMAVSPRISPRLVLRMYNARPLSVHEAPSLYQILGELASRARLPTVPQLHYIPTKVMNAFSVGDRNNAAIGITDGLLGGLNMRELTGILAHEVSHISNNDMRVMAIADMISRFTGIFATVGQFLLFLNLPLLLVGAVTVPWLAILLLLAAPLLSDLLQLALSRTREFDADLDAARLTGDPEGLAIALQKLEYQQSSILGRIFLPGRRIPDPSIFRTHPDTKERIRRLLQLTPAEAPYFYPALDEMYVFPGHIRRVMRGPRWRLGGFWY